MVTRRFSVGLVALAVLAVAGCPASADDLCAKGTCEPSISATAPSGDGGPPIVIAPRDNCVDKPLAQECVDEKTAIFVSRSADPNGADGTLAHPYASIRTALERVTEAKKRVYVCEGTYEEQVSIEKIPATVIGGVTCDFKSPGAKPKIAPPSGIALAVAAVGGASVLNVVVQASSDANAKGSSSIGMFVTTAKDILLRGVDVIAGPAQPGLDAAAGTQNWSGTAAGPNNASGATGGAAPDCGKCLDGDTYSTAGQGGTANGALPGTGGAKPKVGSGNAGSSSSMTPTAGTAGANGEPRPAASGAARAGVLMATSWNTETTAQRGPIGNPGQGGGGGGANATTGGGSGGCGGCGGGGGLPGGNGGSSIALLVFQSEVKLEACTLTASEGGAGGSGSEGLAGQGPSFGGSGICGGGPGGYGAGGGGGGGGAGGHSAAIAHVGAAPAKDDKTLLKKSTPGAFGKGGAGGKPSDPSGNEGNEGESGAPGTAADVLSLE